MCKHAHTRANIRATHTPVHTYMCKREYMCTHLRVQTYMHMCAHVHCKHTCVRAGTPLHVQTCTHTEQWERAATQSTCLSNHSYPSHPVYTGAEKVPAGNLSPLIILHGAWTLSLFIQLLLSTALPPLLRSPPPDTLKVFLVILGCFFKYIYTYG